MSVREVRLFLLGQGRQGKTSLARALRDPSGRAAPIAVEDRTVALDVVRGWRPGPPDSDVQVRTSEPVGWGAPGGAVYKFSPGLCSICDGWGKGERRIHCEKRRGSLAEDCSDDAGWAGGDEASVVAADLLTSCASSTG